jgi:hypothetical protein
MSCFVDIKTHLVLFIYLNVLKQSMPPYARIQATVQIETSPSNAAWNESTPADMRPAVSSPAFARLHTSSDST